MHIHELAKNLLLELPGIDAWPEMQQSIENAAAKCSRDWLLPVLACEALGENSELAVPTAAAIGCMQMSIILIDDILDKDPRGEYHRIGEGAAANLAAALQAAGLEAICYGLSRDEIKLNAIRKLNTMLLTTAMGQNLDIQNAEDEASYWKIVHTKSSPFFGAALYVGALAGGADPATAAQIEEYGRLYGEMIQIHDDLKDTMEIPANPDWILGRASLPILYTEIVDHADRERFLALRKSISDPDALREAQTIIIRCGAVSYCIDQILNKYGAAKEILNDISITYPERLETLMTDVIEPVRNLFIEIGIEPVSTIIPAI